MTVESFDPTAQSGHLDGAVIAQLLVLAQGDPDKPLSVSADEALQLAFTARHPDWLEQAKQLDDEELVQLARFYTVAEQQLSGWRADDKSPVIAFVRELKNRRQFDAQLRKWIKAHTDNKFLPHGSLTDLL